MSDLLLICITCIVCSFFLWLTIRRAVLSVQEREVMKEVSKMYLEDRNTLGLLKFEVETLRKNNDAFGDHIRVAIDHHYRVFGGIKADEPPFFREVIYRINKYKEKLDKLNKIMEE